MARTLVARLLLLIAVCSSPVPELLAQNEPRQVDTIESLRTQIGNRFQILPLANGVALVPRFKTEVRSIEVTGQAIAVDGSVVTGSELREKLGSDADLVLKLSYLEPEARRSVAGLQPPPSPEPQQVLESSRPADEARGDRRRTRRRNSLVRFGGDVNIPADETVAEDVVLIGGDATVSGQVNGDLVVVGGSATLAATANVHGDVVVVGGRLYRDPDAVVGGDVQEVAIDTMGFGREWFRTLPGVGWNPMSGLYPVARFAGTAARVGLLMLLCALVLLVARTPVERIADRAGAEPVKSWIVGFLAELLFVPLIIMTIFVLLISIVGIPLLVLIPVLIVAACIAALVGFTGVAYQLGRIVQMHIDALRSRPYLSTFVGIVAIVSPLILARLLGLTGMLGFFGGTLIAISIVLEYVAWTTGIGAAALARFGGPIPSMAVPSIPQSPIINPPMPSP